MSDCIIEVSFYEIFYSSFLIGPGAVSFQVNLDRLGTFHNSSDIWGCFLQVKPSRVKLFRCEDFMVAGRAE